MTEPDYITVLPTTDQRYIVVIMKWRADLDSHVQDKASQPLHLEGAQRIAKDWGIVRHLEVRL